MTRPNERRGESCTIRRVISRVHSFVLQGIDAIACEIEADLSPVGLPKTTVVGQSARRGGRRLPDGR